MLAFIEFFMTLTLNIGKKFLVQALLGFKFIGTKCTIHNHGATKFFLVRYRRKKWERKV